MVNFLCAGTVLFFVLQALEICIHATPKSKIENNAWLKKIEDALDVEKGYSLHILAFVSLLILIPTVYFLWKSRGPWFMQLFHSMKF